MDENVKILLEKAAKAPQAHEAMNFAQAALNAAHALQGDAEVTTMTDYALTDEDREIVRLISESDDSGVQPSLLEDCYSYGIRAGIARGRALGIESRSEEIAKLRTLLMRWHDTYGGSTVGYGARRKPVDEGLDSETLAALDAIKG